MAFVTGMFLIDAPASALNNLGQIPGSRTDNTVGVKIIPTREGGYPYVSAQAFRYWLRKTLEHGEWGWVAAPVYREAKVAYTDANPLKYWDDDLFGYMRAPSKRESARAAREADESRAGETPTKETVTRISPFRVSTLVSLAPTGVVDDFGVMSRQEGDPVPHEHQFYRTTLKGLFSLDLHAVGTFTYRQKTGYLNLDEEREKEAKEKELEHLVEEKAFRVPLSERISRITALFEGLAHLDGGAKQTIHYTDVSPRLVIMAVTKGGNHVFGHVVDADVRHRPVMKIEALRESLDVFADDILSQVYVGWTKGYLDGERARFTEALSEGGILADFKERIKVSHPRQAFQAIAATFQNEQNSGWFS
ncbi:MAG: type I-B CRISPR-associated protein Cas7/Cst2/DevR [Deltaproteobacteria bacterium]|nr:type I-B CRISPR-associated protein Cas7/Cst2/DevR [Deltaproteobacteria bacterium]MBW2071448.1 type I-B CRISPR-associated protein Cas7/Cst2/DevR [Deltaproteobacteria bacterium]